MFDFIGSIESYQAVEPRLTQLWTELGAKHDIEYPKRLCFILDSLYGCALKLLHFVVQTRLCTVSAAQYDRFNAFYYSYNQLTDHSKLENESYYALNLTQTPSRIPRIIIILGNVFGGQGKSDFLTCYVFSRIIQAGINIRVTMSPTDLFGIVTRRLVFQGRTNISLINEENFRLNEYLRNVRATLVTGALVELFSLDYLLPPERPHNFSIEFMRKYTKLFLGVLENICLIKYYSPQERLWLAGRNYTGIICTHPRFYPELMIPLLRIIDELNGDMIRDTSIRCAPYDLTKILASPEKFINALNYVLYVALRAIIADGDDSIWREPPFNRISMNATKKVMVLNHLFGAGENFCVQKFLNETHETRAETASIGNPDRELINFKLLNVCAANPKSASPASSPIISIASDYGKVSPLLPSPSETSIHPPLRGRGARVCGINASEDTVSKFIGQAVVLPRITSAPYRPPNVFSGGIELEFWGINLNFTVITLELISPNLSYTFIPPLVIDGFDESRKMKELVNRIIATLTQSGDPGVSDYLRFINEISRQFRSRDRAILAAIIKKFSLIKEIIEITDWTSFEAFRCTSPKLIPLQRTESFASELLKTVDLTLDTGISYVFRPGQVYLCFEIASHPGGTSPKGNAFAIHPLEYFQELFRFAAFLRAMSQRLNSVPARVLFSPLCSPNTKAVLVGNVSFMTIPGETFEILGQFTFPVHLSQFAPRKLNAAYIGPDFLVQTIALNSTDLGEFRDDNFFQVKLQRDEPPMLIIEWDTFLLILSRSLVEHLTNRISRTHTEAHWLWVDGSLVCLIWVVLTLCMGGNHSNQNHKNLYLLFFKSNPRSLLIALFLKDNEYYQSFLLSYKGFLEEGGNDREFSAILNKNLTSMFSQPKVRKLNLLFNEFRTYQPRIVTRLGVQIDRPVEASSGPFDTLSLVFSFLLSALPNPEDTIPRALASTTLNIPKIVQDADLMKTCFVLSSYIKVSGQPNTGQLKCEIRGFERYTEEPPPERLRKILEILTGVGHPIVSASDSFDDGEDTISPLSQAASNARSGSRRHESQWIKFHPKEGVDRRAFKRFPRKTKT